MYPRCAVCNRYSCGIPHGSRYVRMTGFWNGVRYDETMTTTACSHKLTSVGDFVTVGRANGDTMTYTLCEVP